MLRSFAVSTTVVMTWSLIAGLPTMAEPIPVRLTDTDIHHLELADLGADAWELRTTGTDPYVFTEPLQPLPETSTQHILCFDYFCESGTDSFQVFFGPTPSEARSLKAPGLGIAEGWIEHSVDLAESPAWEGRIPSLRLDFGNHADRIIRIRNIRLRQPNARERELAARREAEREAERRLYAHLGDYLEASYPCTVTHVAVEPSTVRIRVDRSALPEADIHLCEVPLYQHVTELDAFVFSTPLRKNDDTVVLPRYRRTDDRTHDRLLSKWVLARRNGDRWELLSHARYADDDAIAGQRDLPGVTPVSRKGLGGFGPQRHDNGSDADALGIGYVTVNVVLSFMQPEAGEHTIPFDYCGRTYYAHRDAIEQYDRTMRFCAERNIVVSAIILIPKAGGFGGHLGPIFMHPDCDPKGIFTMANVTSAEGLDYYAAALDFLAERYSREDGQYGRVHHWIVHNEVDAGWVWTNAGTKPARTYVDLYHKSMRVVHLIARKYDPDAKAFASLTHHWAEPGNPKFYGSRKILELLAAFSAAEGDLNWGIAFHPYPQSLRNPRSWEDTQAQFHFDTPQITFKNIEVLAAWVEQPFVKYRGTERRTIHLSEQGPNSPDYSDQSLRDQAACMAYAWKKIQVLDAIEAFQYHNWIDNPHEGGLRIGLRKFPGPEHQAAPKPVWFVYRDLDTPREDEACDFAKEVLGIENWDEVRYTDPIR